MARRAMRVLPGFEYRFWTDADNAALVEKYFPEKIDLFLSCPHGVVRADIARCLYLYDQGGIYADTDYFFFRAPPPSFFEEECVLGIEEEWGREFGNVKYGNAFMASRAGFDIWPLYVEGTLDRLQKGEDRVVFIGGPHALTNSLLQNQSFLQKIAVMPRHIIYPDFKILNLAKQKKPKTIGVNSRILEDLITKKTPAVTMVAA